MLVTKQGALEHGCRQSTASLHQVMCESKKREDFIWLLGMSLLKEFIRTPVILYYTKNK